MQTGVRCEKQKLITKSMLLFLKYSFKKAMEKAASGR